MFTGWKTYAVGGAMIAVGMASTLGLFDLIGVHIAEDPMTLIMGGAGLIFARNGAKTEAAKVKP
jgi:hypothetical protein